MRLNVKQVLRKCLTVLLRAIVIFLGLPLLAHFYKHTLPELIRSNSALGHSILFASVILPMALDSVIDRDDKSNQTLTTNERGN